MSPLPAGKYRLRWIPPNTHFPFFGGVYATGEEFKEQIIAAPLPTPVEQIWGINPVDHKDSIYTITLPIFRFPGGPAPVIPGWSLHTQLPPIVPVTLDLNIAEWIINEIDAKNKVYQIRALNNPRLGVVVADDDQVFASPAGESQWQLMIPNNS